MMLLAEIAREEGLFDWLAAVATRHAKGSARRLFLLIYGVGTIVTIFLSNDATAVVLTPAVAAAVQTAKAEAAAALPADLRLHRQCRVVRAADLQSGQSRHLRQPHAAAAAMAAGLCVPSVVSIAATYLLLRWTQRGALGQGIATDVPVPILSAAGKTAAIGIAATAIVLLVASALDIPLGLPTAIAGTATAAVVLIREREGTVDHRQGYLLGRAAAGRRAFRAGRGARQDRADRHDHGAPP